MSESEKRTEEVAVYWTNAQPVVSSFISSVVPRFQDADDILQQVAVAIVKNYDKYDKRRPFVAWAIGIARNEILMYRRKNAKGRVILDTEVIQKVSEAYEKESAGFDDMRKALDYCINQLRDRWKQVLKMRYLRELEISRVAQKLGMTHSSVYTTLHRIRVALRDCIERRLSSEEIR